MSLKSTTGPMVLRPENEPKNHVTSPQTISIPQEMFHLLRDVLSSLETGGMKEIWLVGGAVRDLMLGQIDLSDLDLAVPQNPTTVARRFSREYESGFVVLDEEHAIVRILKTLYDRHITIDISKFRAPQIEDDLRARDFTFNAMAVKLTADSDGQNLPLYDPLGGYGHLINRHVEACSDKTFLDDPLRLLRAYRFGAKFQGTLSERLLEMIKRDADLIVGISAERIRDEFLKTLSAPNSAPWIRGMVDGGIMKHIFPELVQTQGVLQNEWHHLDVYDHTLATLEAFEKILNDLPKFDGREKFQRFLHEPISGTRTFEELFKFACLLHDLGKPSCRKEHERDGRIVFHGHEMVGADMAEKISERLRLSNPESRLLMKVVKNHMRPGVMIQEGINDRRLFRYFSETGRDGIGIALLSLADRLSAQGPNNTDDLTAFHAGIIKILEDFYHQMEYAKRAPLITGSDLIKEFKLPPGPQFKEILAAISENQHLGLIKSREEAIALARTLLQNPP